MSEGRDIYHEPEQNVLLVRTADVYQTEAGRRRGRLLGQRCSPSWPNYHERRSSPRASTPRAMVGKSKRGEVAFRLFAAVDRLRCRPGVRRRPPASRRRGCLAMTGCASATCSMIEGQARSTQALALTHRGRAGGRGRRARRARRAHSPCSPSRPCAALVGDCLAPVRRAGLAELDARGCPATPTCRSPA